MSAIWRDAVPSPKGFDFPLKLLRAAAQVMDDGSQFDDFRAGAKEDEDALLFILDRMIFPNTYVNSVSKRTRSFVKSC